GPARARPDAALRRRVTLVEQRPILLRGTVRDNLGFGLRARGMRRADVNRVTEAVAARFGVTPLLERHRHELSEGEVQRVAVARDPSSAPHRHLRKPRAPAVVGAERVRRASDAALPAAAGRRTRHRGRGCGARGDGDRGGRPGPPARPGRTCGVRIQGQRGAGVLGMPISYLTRIVEFTATHRIRRADWSVDRNAAEFGKAAVDHSHRYQCRVTVKGALQPEASGVTSLVALDALLAEEVTRRLDGRN